MDDIYTVCIADLNVPGAKSSEAISELAACIQFVNDQSPARSIGLLEMPEVAKKTSKRGLCDEEQEVQTCFWALRQTCDTRWICPFSVHPSAELQTNRRHTMPKVQKNNPPIAFSKFPQHSRLLTTIFFNHIPQQGGFRFEGWPRN